jgi:hypothetical protein
MTTQTKLRKPKKDAAAVDAATNATTQKKLQKMKAVVVAADAAKTNNK